MTFEYTGRGQHGQPVASQGGVSMFSEQRFPEQDVNRTATWIEVGRGLPSGAVRQSQELGVDDDEVVAHWTNGSQTTELKGRDLANVVAFTEFLSGTRFEQGERDWLVDILAREFKTHGEAAAEQLSTLSEAVDVIPRLEPFDRANRRYKALALLYRAALLGRTAGIPAPPILTIIDAHNPAIINDDLGSVPTDSLHYRRVLNQLVLDVGRVSSQPALRSRLESEPTGLSPVLRFELAGSQIRLVVIRTWLESLEEAEFSRLQARLGQLLDTATDLDTVVMQLSFRAMIEAIGEQTRPIDSQGAKTGTV